MNNHNRKMSIQSLTAYKINELVYKPLLNIILDLKDFGTVPRIVAINTLAEIDTLSTCLINHNIDDNRKYLETLNTKRRSIESLLNQCDIK